MCFAYQALPPELPSSVLGALRMSGVTPGVASTEQIVLTSQDGTQFAAYRVRPTSPSGAAIVVMPDVRGLFRFYQELAERFATAGIDALTIDYFGRTAGVSVRDAQFEYMPHLMQTKPEQVAQDVAAAVAALRGDPAGAPKAIFTVGFCFGGQQSLNQAANGHGLSGVISFYGPPVTNRMGGPAPIDRIKDFTCPVLAFYGGADQGIPATDVATFDAALAQASIEHEVVTYPGAPHSFFDRSFDTYKDESADAWKRSLAFITKHTPKTTV